MPPGRSPSPPVLSVLEVATGGSPGCFRMAMTVLFGF